MTLEHESRVGAQPHSYAGRETPELIVFESTWPAPNYLRPAHKTKFREYYSKKQGYDGRNALCCLCGKLGEVAEMDVHHLDHIISNNALTNIACAHGKCNDIENNIWKAKQRAAYAAIRVSDQTPGEGVRLAGVQASRQMTNVPYSNREGIKHDIQRPRYDKWIRDLVNGPFATRYSWPIDLLAEKAPYACSEKFGEALGSSKTYKKFIKEDAAFGLLVEDIEEGVASVTLNKELLKKIQEQTGQ